MSNDSQTSRYIIGIDPGAKGAIAILDTSTGEIIEIIDMPSYKIDSPKTAAHGKLRVSALGLAKQLRKYEGAQCCIEKVGSRPGNGVSATFAFGQAFGIVIGVCAALGMAVSTARPQEWLSSYKQIIDGNDKNEHRACATAIYSANASSFKRAKDDGRADAVLIAKYFLDNSKSFDNSNQAMENALSW